jgi:photosystem II stability/assembly factor-like uncharacterized protein
MKINFYLCSRIAGLILFFAISIEANAQWVKTYLPTTPYNSVSCFADFGTDIFACSDYLVLSKDSGTSWTAVVNTGLPGGSSSISAYGTNLFVISDKVYISTDSGKIWSLANVNFNGIHIFAATSEDLIAINDSGVFISTDNAANWTKVSSDLKNVSVSSLVVNGINLYAGTTTGDFFISGDNGTTWLKKDESLNSNIFALAVNNSSLFAGTNKGVFLSTDSGTSWTALNTGLTNAVILSFAVIGTNIFVGTWGGGVFLSTNNGTTWANMSSGLADLNISALVVSGGYLFAGAYDNGSIWRRSLSEMIKSFASPLLSQSPEFTLKQNTPNPFSTATTIHYSIPTREHVRITVSNMLGEKMKTLLDEDADPGEHDLTLTTNDLPNEMYIVTVNAGGRIESEKVTLVR